MKTKDKFGYITLVIIVIIVSWVIYDSWLRPPVKAGGITNVGEWFAPELPKEITPEPVKEKKYVDWGYYSCPNSEKYRRRYEPRGRRFSPHGFCPFKTRTK